MAHVPELKDGSILAVTSKIVALAEGAVVQTLTARAKDALIRAESEWAAAGEARKIGH